MVRFLPFRLRERSRHCREDANKPPDLNGKNLVRGGAVTQKKEGGKQGGAAPAARKWEGGGAL